MFYRFLLLHTCYSLLISSTLSLSPWQHLRDFSIDDEIEVMAGMMTSKVARIHHKYYSAKFCEHSSGVSDNEENLGEILQREKDAVIPITVMVLREMQCRVICKKVLSPVDTDIFISRIENEYFVDLTLNEIPVATEFIGSVMMYDLGYRIGFVREGRYYINNHLDFTVKYHQSAIQGQYRIVGFAVKPSSIHRAHYENSSDCAFPEIYQPQDLITDNSDEIVFSYSVDWVESEASWSSRWDNLLRPRHQRMHWFSVVNAIAIVLMLSGVVAVILIRILRRDISYYNHTCDEMGHGAFDETGWKLVHGDVFRPPTNFFTLTVLLGSGVQLFCTILVVLVLTSLNILSPNDGNNLFNGSMATYVVMGCAGGYMSGKFYKTMGGFDYRTAAISTGTFYPLLLFVLSSLIHVLFMSNPTSHDVPMPTVVTILSLWSFTSVPLVYIGFHLGYNRQRYEHPVRTNLIPRPIPQQPMHLSAPIICILAGFLPFLIVFIEFYFVLTAVWEHHSYYLVAFLFLMFVIFTLSTCQVAIIFTYLLLCAEHYKWWWRSSYLLSVGFTAYVFVYTLLYHYTRVESVGVVSFASYWVYSAFFLISLWLLSGTIGLYSSYVFVCKIYCAIKID